MHFCPLYTMNNWMIYPATHICLSGFLFFSKLLLVSLNRDFLFYTSVSILGSVDRILVYVHTFVVWVNSTQRSVIIFLCLLLGFLGVMPERLYFEVIVVGLEHWVERSLGNHLHSMQILVFWYSQISCLCRFVQDGFGAHIVLLLSVI